MSASKPDNDARQVLAAAARYVRSGVRSTSEVRGYLLRHGLPPQTAARVVSEYRTRGLLDDRACARLWAEHWARRGYAWAAIREKLSGKGLAEEAITAAAGRLNAPEQEIDRARRLIAGRVWLRADTRQRARVARALSLRGFDVDLIEQLLSDPFNPPASDADAEQ